MIEDKAVASRLWAVVPAAGRGSRFGAVLPKQYLPLAGKTVIEHSIAALLRCPEINEVLVALHAEDETFIKLACAKHPKVRSVTGGLERAESVELALAALNGAAATDWVLVHDAARPCLSDADIHALLLEGREHPLGAILAARVVDTVKRVNAQREAVETVDRNTLWRALTPQLFRYGELRAALKHCREHALPVTDEASAIEQFGGRPLLVEGSHRNIKITYPDDLTIATAFLAGGVND